jgi:hypothetical protein
MLAEKKRKQQKIIANISTLPSEECIPEKKISSKTTTSNNKDTVIGFDDNKYLPECWFKSA